MFLDDPNAGELVHEIPYDMNVHSAMWHWIAVFWISQQDYELNFGTYTLWDLWLSQMLADRWEECDFIMSAFPLLSADPMSANWYNNFFYLFLREELYHCTRRLCRMLKRSHLRYEMTPVLPSIKEKIIHMWAIEWDLENLWLHARID